MLKRVTVICVEEFDEDWPSQQASEFINWIFDKVSRIPVDYMDSAVVDIDATSGGCPVIDIYYDRPETPEEESIRLDERLKARERTRAGELETLRKLKQKYGDLSDE